MKKALIILLMCLLTACGKKAEGPNQLRVGTIAGPETQLMEKAREVAKAQYGLQIEIIEFNDYNTPNIALNDGSIDANMFQHQPFLDAVIQARQYPLVSAGKIYIYPMALYSKKIKSLSELQDGATVAIPSDPTNEARALRLLSEAGLIELKTGFSVTATTTDIKSNPKHLVFKEIDAAAIPRILPDVDLAAINTNFAIVANLTPSDDGLFVENSASPYANIVVVKASSLQDARIKKLIEALHSEPVAKEAKALFKNQAIQAW